MGGLTRAAKERAKKSDYLAHLALYIPDYNLNEKAKSSSSAPLVSLCLKSLGGENSAVKKIKIVVVRCGDSTTFSTSRGNRGLEDLMEGVEVAGNIHLGVEVVAANSISAVSHLLGSIAALHVPELRTKFQLPPIDGDSCEIKLDLRPSMLPDYAVGKLAGSRFLQQESLEELTVKCRVALEGIDVGLFFGVPIVGVPGGSGEMERKGMEGLGSCVVGWLLKSKSGLLLRTKKRVSGGGMVVVVPMMEIYPIQLFLMICVLHNGDRKQ